MHTPPDPEVDKLIATIADYPDVLELRLRLIALLAVRGRTAEALIAAGEALQLAPGNPEALAAVAGLSRAGSTDPGDPAPAVTPGFDWVRAEAQFADTAHPPFPGDTAGGFGAPTPRAATRLADVVGMDEVKAQIDRSFLRPLRNPALARSYGATAGGGLLLYGPPGCGKTFIASAIAGELGAAFYPVGVPDVVDLATGATDQQLRELFATARRNAPAVIFFDEIDAIGQRRSQLRGGVLRQLVTRLLTELDAARSGGGVFVLGATNCPWDVDPALRRPGRFDRTLFVSPPDPAARAALLHADLSERPVTGIDLAAIVTATAGYSGADLRFLCQTAAEHALAESAESDEPRPISMADVKAALRVVGPSTGPWLTSARNVVEFGNADGAFDELAAYLRRRRPR